MSDINIVGPLRRRMFEDMTIPIAPAALPLLSLPRLRALALKISTGADISTGSLSVPSRIDAKYPAASVPAALA